MKKILLVTLLIISFVASKSQTVNSRAQDKLSSDIIITMLSPYIRDEIIKYYGYSKSYDLYNIEFKEISRINGYRFYIKILVKTFEHAHNPPYGNETITFEISPSEVKVLDFNHQGDKYEKIIKQFYDDVLLDIKQSFSLNLNDFDEYKYNQLYHLSLSQEQFKSLYEIVKDIILNELKYETKSGYKNVIEPVTYIKNNQGYILYKQSDGTNIVYKLEMDNNIWIIKNKLNKQGKVMDYKLKWYM